MPTFMSIIRQYSRWPMLGYESLRPVSRSAFLKENAAAIGLQVAEMWLMMAVMLLIEIAVLAPAVLGTANPWRMLAGTAIYQPLFFASFGISLFRLRNIFSLIALGLLYGFAFPLGIVFADVVVSIPVRWQVLIFVLMLVTSILILWEAYRYWLRVDLD